jgi:hypothetical protein
MRQQGSWRRWLGPLLVAATLATAPGCMACFHRIVAAPPELAQACQEVSCSCRDHIYVFLVHGMDPLDWANLEGVRDYCRRLGFRNTYYGQLYHTSYFRKEISRIHREAPDARFVLIGFSFGANMVRNIAQDIKQEGIPVDLLVYLGGNTLKNIPRDRPENAARIVNILASGCIWNGAWFDDAQNLHETDVWHFGSPSHPRTLEVLARELGRIAASQPMVQKVEPAVPIVYNEEPTPRKITVTSTGRPDEWDFLKPVSRLKSAPESKLAEDGSDKEQAPAKVRQVAGQN